MSEETILYCKACGKPTGTESGRTQHWDGGCDCTKPKGVNVNGAKKAQNKKRVR